MHNDTPIKALRGKQLHLLMPAAFGSVGKVTQKGFNGVDLGTMVQFLVLNEDYLH